MSYIISANELKIKGVRAIQDATINGSEAVITIRGKKEYVVISLDKYNELREYELEAALLESKKDINNGNFTVESVEEHLKRISNG
ncbi:MAG: prevent-host-death protein [Bacteroidetes bacterium]|nr:prevent-host-death protein [Bacteroidota bacterium]MBU1679231.1 prevent-host-death protein [Bacteroidota bacterium]MBU2507450.1 prevent-host-death protein [Bacteroidota bacterium]